MINTLLDQNMAAVTSAPCIDMHSAGQAGVQHLENYNGWVILAILSLETICRHMLAMYIVALQSN
jgi:hypothetical protein